MYCPNCAVRLVAHAIFCHRCGTRVAEARPDDLDGGGSESDGSEPDEAGEESADSLRAGRSGTLPDATDAGETEIWEGSFSPRAMFPSLAATAVGSLGGLIAAVIAYMDGHPRICVMLVVAVPLLWVFELLRVVKRCLSVYYRLTDRRLFLQVGLWSHHKDQLDLARVEDVRIRQNLFDRFLDVGSIEVLSSDRRLRRVVLEGISGADELAEKLRRCARRVREEKIPMTKSQ